MVFAFETPVDDINDRAIGKIRDLMKRHKRSVASIANGTGINYRTLYRYLNDGTDLNLFDAYRLATMLWEDPNNIWTVGTKTDEWHTYWWDERTFNAMDMDKYTKLVTETFQGAIDSANCRVPISEYCRVQDISRPKFYRIYNGERIPPIGLATSLAAYAGKCVTDIWRYPSSYDMNSGLY